jgi:hypothetical protein
LKTTTKSGGVIRSIAYGNQTDVIQKQMKVFGDKENVISAFNTMLCELEAQADADNNYDLQARAIEWRKLFGEMIK